MRNFKFFQTLSCMALVAGLSQLGWSAPSSPAQAHASANSAAKAASSTAAMASTKGESATVKNGTKISTRLMSNVDARTAKKGDKVVARVTKNVKQHGRVVIHKGDRLVGHITSVQNSLKGKGGSSLGVRFDQLVQGNTTTQLNTVLTSVLSAGGSGQAGGSGAMEVPAMPAPMAAPAGGGGGGLLGGVGSTAGSTVGSTVGAAGSTLGQAGGTVGAATQNTLGANSSLGLSTPVRQIHIGSSASAETSAGTNSTLSTHKGDLRLASGTRMKFKVAGNANAQAN